MHDGNAHIFVDMNCHDDWLVTDLDASWWICGHLDEGLWTLDLWRWAVTEEEQEWYKRRLSVVCTCVTLIDV